VAADHSGARCRKWSRLSRHGNDAESDAAGEAASSIPRGRTATVRSQMSDVQYTRARANFYTAPHWKQYDPSFVWQHYICTDSRERRL